MELHHWHIQYSATLAAVQRLDIDLDNGIKGVLDIKHILLKVVYGNGLSSRVYNPVFANSCIFVVVELADIIVCRIAGRNNFNDEIRRTIAPLSIQLILITDNHYVRLNDCKRLIRQLYIIGMSLFYFLCNCKRCSIAPWRLSDVFVTDWPYCRQHHRRLPLFYLLEKLRTVPK